MRYRIRLSAEADAELPRLPGHVRQRFRRLIASPADAPRPPEALQLPHQPGTYRIRLGRFRLAYQVDDERHLVSVLRAGPKEGPEFYDDLPDP